MLMLMYIMPWHLSTWVMLAFLGMLGMLVLGILAVVVFLALKKGSKTEIISPGAKPEKLDEETRRVEALVASGKITAQEGAELFKALGHEPTNG